MIIGLPGESRDDAIATAQHIVNAGSDGIKIQMLQVLEGTKLAKEITSYDILAYSLEAYTDLLIDILHILPPEMVVHRITGDPPKRLLISPQWTADKKHVLNYINSRIAAANTD